MGMSKEEIDEKLKSIWAGKSTIPALEGILIEAENGKVTLTGYDLEVGSVIVIDAEVEERGKIILAARQNRAQSAPRRLLSTTSRAFRKSSGKFGHSAGR